MRQQVRENLKYMAKEEWSVWAKRAGVAGLVLAGLAVGGSMIAKIPTSQEIIEERKARAEIQDSLETRDEQEASAAPSFDREALSHISIPKIGVRAPIVFVDSVKPDDFIEPLKRGVTHYPSSLPGEQGTTMILGHSSPFGFLGGAYDGVFSELSQLEKGELISITNNETVYAYEVQDAIFLQSGDEIPASLMTENSSRLLLISCWPPGIDNKRIVVQADYLR